MSTWHYQVIETEHPNGFRSFGVHEIFDMHDVQGIKCKTWTEKPVSVVGDSRQDIIDVLEMMLSDLKRHPEVLQQQVGCEDAV